MRFVLLTAALFAFSQTFAATEKSISISGQCLKKVIPDRGSVNLAAEFVDKDPSIASKKAMALYEKLRQEIKSIGLKDLELETSAYTVNEEIDWVKNKRVFRGYRASMGLEVTTSEIEKIGQVLAKATPLGIQKVENFNLFISEKKNQEVHEACLAEAIINAKNKALKMADAAQAKLGPVVTISEQTVSAPIHYAMRTQMSGMMKDQAESAPAIEAKAQTISVSVSVIFSLL